MYGIVSPHFTEDPQRAITVLVAACPTALALAGPATLVAAITAAARRNIVIKDPALFERLDEIDVIALDKTGTLTHGQGRVESAYPIPGAEELLLMYAAICGQGSLIQYLVRYAWPHRSVDWMFRLLMRVLRPLVVAFRPSGMNMLFDWEISLGSLSRGSQ